MKTYDCFGRYYSNKRAELDISLPDKDYEYSYCNISANGWNAIVISFKIKPADPGDVLENLNFNFETLLMDLEDINLKKLQSSGTHNVHVDDLDYSKPILIFTYHDKDITTYDTINRRCYDDILITIQGIDNPTLEDIIKGMTSPARLGSGVLKRI